MTLRCLKECGQRGIQTHSHGWSINVMCVYVSLFFMEVSLHLTLSLTVGMRLSLFVVCECVCVCVRESKSERERCSFQTNNQSYLTKTHVWSIWTKPYPGRGNSDGTQPGINAYVVSDREDGRGFKVPAQCSSTHNKHRSRGEATLTQYLVVCSEFGKKVKVCCVKTESDAGRNRHTFTIVTALKLWILQHVSWKKHWWLKWTHSVMMFS